MIKQTPSRTDEHGDIQREEHALRAQPPRASHHTDSTNVQRCDRQGDAHARKRTRELPNADEAHEGDNADERGQRREQRNGNRSNQDNSGRDRLREITPGLPRCPTCGMIVASGARGEDSGKK